MITPFAMSFLQAGLPFHLIFRPDRSGADWQRILSGVSPKLALSVCELVPIWCVMAIVCGIILEP